MGEDKKTVHGRMDCAGLMGPLWIMGWLFTIGFIHLPIGWKALLALILWPYYLGQTLG